MSERLTSEELLAKMKAHIKERKAVYDALVDNQSRVIANSGIESLQTAESDNHQTAHIHHDGENTNTVINEDKTNRYPQLESDHLEETAYQWSNVIGRKIHTALPGRLAIALLQLDDCNYDHDCGGEGDYPRCKECRAVRIMRGLIVELGAHGIGSEGLTP